MQCIGKIIANGQRCNRVLLAGFVTKPIAHKNHNAASIEKAQLHYKATL
jgi:hypothetical protein